MGTITQWGPLRKVNYPPVKKLLHNGCKASKPGTSANPSAQTGIGRWDGHFDHGLVDTPSSGAVVWGQMFPLRTSALRSGAGVMAGSVLSAK